MLKIIDTHAHLNFKAYQKDADEVIKRALKNDILMINVGVDFKTSEKAVELTEKYPEGIFAAVGLHPTGIEDEDFDRGKYKKLAQKNKAVAIGETGLDYYRIEQGADRKSQIAKQKEVFKKHIDLAIELNKPLIIHCRDAHDDLIEILKDKSSKLKANLNGVIHCFTGNLEQAKEYRGLRFKIGLNGIITFSRDYDKVILDTPLEDILLETDCPYLTPVPYRGQRNESSYVIEVAKKLAEIKNLSLEKTIEQTTRNAKEVFTIY